MEKTKTPGSVDEYIDGYPPEIRKRLNDLRNTIKKAAPDAEEKISYGMPALTLKGMLVYYAAHTKHIGLYPFTTAIQAFKEELSQYKTAMGSIQFPNEKPLPLKLVSDIIKFRVAENLMKAEMKAAAKKK